MNDTLAFRELLEVFEQPPPQSVPEDKLRTNPRALLYRGATLDPQDKGFFVPPDLMRANDAPLGSPFWLVSAPAAVGKSKLAKALGAAITSTGRKAVYVPLRGTTLIGRDFFGGFMAAVFDSASQEQQRTAVRSSQVVVLLDGYDELSMTDEQVTAHRLLAEELLKYVGDDGAARSTPSIVVLFRSAIRSLGIFDSLVGHALDLEIEYFDEPKQTQFLMEYVESKDLPMGLPTAADLLAALKEGILGVGGASLEARMFFGHAPVLRAIGDLVVESEEQPHVLARLLREEAAGDWGARLLLRIIGEMMQRESHKFPGALFTQHGLPPIPSPQVYSLELQVELLGAIVASTVAAGDWEVLTDVVIDEHWQHLCRTIAALTALASDEREGIKKQFREEIREELQRHPFLERSANGVSFSNPLYFEKFLADVLCEKVVLPSEGFAYYPHPSYYLAEFILQRLPKRDVHDHHDLVYYVLRSLVTAGGDEFETEAVFTRGGWEVTVGSATRQLEPFLYGGVDLRIAVPSGDVLEGLSLDGSGSGRVVITAVNGDPSTSRLVLSQVSISNAKEISLEGGQLLCSGVKLAAERVVLGQGMVTIEGLGTLEIRGTLEVSDYLRRRYGTTIGKVDEANEDLVFQRKLSSILTWFRKRGKKTFGIYLKRWHTAVLNKDRDGLAVAIAHFLAAVGLIREDVGEQMVFLDEDVAAAYGIHYKKHNEISFGPEFENLVKKWRAYQREH